MLMDLSISIIHLELCFLGGLLHSFNPCAIVSGTVMHTLVSVCLPARMQAMVTCMLACWLFRKYAYRLIAFV